MTDDGAVTGESTVEVVRVETRSLEPFFCDAVGGAIPPSVRQKMEVVRGAASGRDGAADEDVTGGATSAAIRARLAAFSDRDLPDAFAGFPVGG